MQLCILTPGALADHNGNVFAKDIEKDYKSCSLLSLHSKYLPLFCQANGSLWKEREGHFLNLTTNARLVSVSFNLVCWMDWIKKH